MGKKDIVHVEKRHSDECSIKWCYDEKESGVKGKNKFASEEK